MSEPFNRRPLDNKPTTTSLIDAHLISISFIIIITIII